MPLELNAYFLLEQRKNYTTTDQANAWSVLFSPIHTPVFTTLFLAQHLNQSRDLFVTVASMKGLLEQTFGEQGELVIDTGFTGLQCE